jgi:predicted DNA-binding transcriptional regulator YafY
VRTREWHPSQTIADADDGGVLMTLDVCIDRALRSWILSFGAAARALSPPALASALEREYADALARYAPAGARTSRND